MIEGQQWLALIGEKTSINYESLLKLQQDFIILITNRLSKGEEVIIPNIGKLERDLQKAFIATVNNGEKYIIPPRIRLVLYKTESSIWGELEKVLKEYSTLTPSNVESYLKAFEEVVRESLSRGESISWQDLGKLSPSKHGTDGFTFTPSDTLMKSVNKVFSFYEPMPLAEGKDFPQLEHRSFQTIEEALIDSPLEPLSTPHPSRESKKSLQEDTTPIQVKTVISSEKTAAPPFLVEHHIADEKEPPIPTPPPLSLACQSSTPPPLPTNNEDLIAQEEKAIPVFTPSHTTSSTAHAVPQEDKLKRRGKKHLWLLLVLLVAIVSLVAFFIIDRANTSNSQVKCNEGNAPQKEETLVDSLKYAEKSLHSLSQASKDSSAVNELTSAPSMEKDSLSMPSIPDHITIDKGTTLTSIAKEIYGNKVFWVYIYEENKAHIKNPNNIALGTQLALPSPSKYGIDAKSKTSIAQAKEIEKQLNTQFKTSSSQKPQKETPRFPSREELYD